MTIDIFMLLKVIGLINQLNWQTVPCQSSLMQFDSLFRLINYNLCLSSDHRHFISLGLNQPLFHFDQILNNVACRFDLKPAQSIATIRLDLNKASQRSAYWKPEPEKMLIVSKFKNQFIYFYITFYTLFLFTLQRMF